MDHGNSSSADKLKYVNTRHIQHDLFMLVARRQSGAISHIGMLHKYPDEMS